MKIRNVILSAGALAVCLSLTSSARADYASTVLSDNPLSFWQFNDASSADGATAFDSAPGNLSPGLYRNLGGVVAPITFVSGPGTGDNGIQLNGTGAGGTGNFIDIPDSANRLNTATTFSLEFWEKSSPQASETYGHFLSHDAPSGGYWAGLAQSGTYPGQPFVGEPGGGTWYAWPPILSDANWHYVVLTYAYSGGNTTETLYIDGNNEGNVAVAGTFTALGTDLLIGAENNQYYVYNGLVGDMADVAYYGQALTQQQITTHYTAVVPEPASVALLGLGLTAGVAFLRRRSA